MTASRLRLCCGERLVPRLARRFRGGKQSSSHPKFLSISSTAGYDGSGSVPANTSVDTGLQPAFGSGNRSSPTHRRAWRRIASPIHPIPWSLSSTGPMHPSPRSPPLSSVRSRPAPFQTPADGKSARGARDRQELSAVAGMRSELALSVLRWNQVRTCQ